MFESQHAEASGVNTPGPSGRPSPGNSPSSVPGGVGSPSSTLGVSVVPVNLTRVTFCGISKIRDGEYLNSSTISNTLGIRIVRIVVLDPRFTRVILPGKRLTEWVVMYFLRECDRIHVDVSKGT